MSLTPSEVVERALAAASHNAFVLLDADGARAQAAASTQRWRSGTQRSALDGVPVAVKDQIDVEGLITTAGTSFLRRVATKDAVAVARLRRAGAVILGKTNMSELGIAPDGRNAHFGRVENPRGATRDPGGSSSGSAAAVAAGIVPLALGTDLGGSLRIPASFCGVAAIKPTFRRVPMQGVLPVSPSLDHLGPIGATVEHVRLALEALSGARLERALPTRLRVGICGRWWRAATAATAQVVEAALVGLGAERIAIALPHLGCAFAVGALTWCAEAATALGAFAAAPLSPRVRIAVEVGRHIRGDEYQQAQRVRALICGELEEAFDRCDVLVTPTTPYSAQVYAADGLDEDAARERTGFTFPANLAGLPAAQVPCGLDAEGLPVGMQVLASSGEDALALAVAAEVEAHAGLPRG